MFFLTLLQLRNSNDITNDFDFLVVFLGQIEKPPIFGFGLGLAKNILDYLAYGHKMYIW